MNINGTHGKLSDTGQRMVVNMDDIIVRPRLPRNTYTKRRRVRNARDNTRLIELIVKQLFVSIIILVLVTIIKSINTPVTNYLTYKIKTVIFTNVETKSIFEGIDNIFKKVSNIIFKKEDKQFNEPAVLASTYDTVDEDNGKKVTALQNESKATETKAQDTGSTGKYKFITPVEGVLGSPFGLRTHPIKKTPENHKGVDIEAVKGTSIKAGLQGEVTEAGSDPSLGNYIKIKHDGGFETIYAHCSTVLVKSRQFVNQGDVIARVGDTGDSIGDHLHFEILKDGKPVDPLDYVKIPLK